jgi:hypothetical protein
MSEILLQNAVIAAAEGHTETFKARLAKRADQSFIKRFGKAAAGNLFREIINLPQTINQGRQDYRLTHSGYENLVYMSDYDVLKINARTLSPEFDAVLESAEGSERDYRICSDYLEEQMLPTQYSVAQFMGRFAVKTTQTRVYPTRLFSGISDLVSQASELDYVDELRLLHANVRKLSEETGYYPDMFGSGNIALVEGRDHTDKLVIIDSQTASPETQELYVPNKKIRVADYIASEMEVLDQFILAT